MGRDNTNTTRCLVCRFMGIGFMGALLEKIRRERIEQRGYFLYNIWLMGSHSIFRGRCCNWKS